MEKGAPPNKLVMGMPLYGQAFTLDSPLNHGLNSPANQKGQPGPFTRAGGFLSFYEICEMITSQNWTVVQDPKGRLGPYAYNDGQWVGYDDVSMIKYKSEYIRKMGLAGGMVWALDLDDFKNRCGQGHHPLMNTIKAVLGPKINSNELAARAGVEMDVQIKNESNDFAEELEIERGAKFGRKVVCCKFYFLILF